MELKKYRESNSERARTDDLLRLIPIRGGVALDVGARDGHFSKLLAEKFDNIIALDLEQPSIEHQKVTCVKGNASDLLFEDASFDLVFCAEVLEHIPPSMLERVCLELWRVSKHYLIIGVPYKQDIRVGRTTCYSCGGKNPPWGHVNAFDERRLRQLFSRCDVEEISFVGETNATTNSLSAVLMDLAGNPYGTYEQEESCIHCEKKLLCPPDRSLIKKLLTRAAFYSRNANNLFNRSHPNWIHVLFRKRPD